MPMIEYSDFEKIEIRVGTIVSAASNPKAKRPAYILRTDFGPHGTKTSSAQITKQYLEEELPGRQVVAVMNFPKKRVAGIESEVLVLAAVDDGGNATLLTPSLPAQNGQRVF